MSMLETLARIATAVAAGSGAAVPKSPPAPAPAAARRGGAAGAGFASAKPAAAAAQPQASAGFGDILGRMIGAGAAGAPGTGGLGGALDDLSQMSRPGAAVSGGRRYTEAPPAAKPKAGGSFGDLLNDIMAGRTARQPSDAEEALARLLIRAMLQAAKSDGRIDRDERQRILKAMGTPGKAEMDFLDTEIARPVDISALVRDTPDGAEAQVYMMALMGIDLDAQDEADFLHQLARALDLTPQMVNAVHTRLGAPLLYR
jgi:hypothetical protein